MSRITEDPSIVAPKLPTGLSPSVMAMLADFEERQDRLRAKIRQTNALRAEYVRSVQDRYNEWIEADQELMEHVAARRSH